jgi:hypothetical protein
VKRHRALVELSRDHQHALAVAQGLRRATPDDAPDAAAAFHVDHLEIRSAARRVSSKAASLPELHDLGDRVTAHVRLEERELFPLIEATLTEPELDSLAAELLAAAP